MWGLSRLVIPYQVNVIRVCNMKDDTTKATIQHYTDAMDRSIRIHGNYVDDKQGYKSKRLLFNTGSRMFSIVVTIIPSSKAPMYVQYLIMNNYYDIKEVLDIFNNLVMYDGYSLH